MTASMRQRHQRVLAQLERTIGLTGDPAKLERRDPEISRWSVGEQIEHVVHVHRSVVDALDRIAAGEGRDGAAPSPAGRLFLFLGWIPRGRGKAPERVRPRGADCGELAAELERERQRFDELDLEDLEAATGTLPHPVFGPLTARRWLRFLEIHNHHHWKIVGDILQSSR